MTEWKSKSLGDLAEIQMGGTPARDTPSNWDPRRTTGNVWVSIADLTALSGRVISDSKEYISDAAAEGRRKVPKGSLLMSFKLSIGKLAFAGRDLFTNEAIAAFILPEVSEVTKEYLYHYLDHLNWTSLALGSEKVKGATLNKAKLKVLTVSYPPLPEQSRIVSLVDEVSGRIDHAEIAVKEQLQILNELRESVIARAFVGEL